MTGGPGRLLKAALRAADEGLFVFPVAPRGKPPMIRDRERRATRDLNQIRAWWQQRRLSNIGAAVGRSGLLVIDLDTASDGDAPPREFTGAVNGRDVLATIARRAGQPAPFDTRTVKTPSVINGSGGRSLHCLRRVITTVSGLVASALSAGVLRRNATVACPVGGVS